MNKNLQKKPDLLKSIWRLMSSQARWWVLWFVHDKFMVGVSGIVFNVDNKVLLLRHRFWPEGSWGLPSGYAQKGESFENTLRREVKEETNLEIKPTKLLSLISGYKLRIEVIYVARLIGGQKKLDSREVIEAEFFSLDQLPNGLLPDHIRIIEEYKETR